MYRKAIEDLWKWKDEIHRKPLIITGARQVGKTWLMKEFGEQAFEDIAYFNFDKDKILIEIFADNIDPSSIILKLELLRGKKIDADNTLIIFDEIQEVPRALTSLKYFCEDAQEYYIISAGSLLGIALHEGTSFPVGNVSFVDLYPLSFHEFMLATNREVLYAPIIDGDFDTIRIFKSKYEEALKQYFLIGGMPEAVSVWNETMDYIKVRETQNEILNTYDQDISKHASPLHVPRMRGLYASIPSQLSNEKKKFVYRNIKEGARGRDYEIALMWLSDCGLIHRVNSLSEIQYPLKAFEDTRAFKVFLSDVGLLSCMAGLDERIMLAQNEIFDAFKGAITEQYILCELLAETSFIPYYWTNRAGTSEVDFVVQGDDGIIPIEVKSGINLKSKSLKVYMEKYVPDLAVRTSLADYKISEVPYENNKKSIGFVVDLPLYAFARQIGHVVHDVL